MDYARSTRQPVNPFSDMRIFGLIGSSLSHSFSAEKFNRFFAENHIDAQYINYELESIDQLADLLNNPLLVGLNVTIPYKQAVLPYLNRISPEAMAIGAVNTIRILRHNGMVELEGFNTDATGFELSLRSWLPNDITGALVLGNGGAARAIVYVLEKLGIQVVRVGRQARNHILSYENLPPLHYANNRLIVNTTPLGTWPDVHSCPPIDYSCITDKHFAYDLVYNPTITQFLSLCSKQGCKIKNGEEMLRLQAQSAWKIWNTDIL